MLWKTARQTLELPQFPLLMGVLNVTPDSFSDGGRWIQPEAAIQHGLQMLREGARILDIGGESSRPGAKPVEEAEELLRILPVVEGLRGQADVLLSIDTMKPGVAAKAIDAGASIVNDIGGLRLAEMRRVVAQTGAGAICMHMQGTPETMQHAPAYGDVVAEVREFFEQTFHRCVDEGVEAEQLMFDPGIGFGKTEQHNLLLLRDLSLLPVRQRPLALGVSRKSFLSRAAGCEGMEARLWPTVALSSYAFDQHVAVVRVHDVAANAAAIRIREAVRAVHTAGQNFTAPTA
jgi:dihydropteroate synthase